MFIGCLETCLLVDCDWLYVWMGRGVLDKESDERLESLLFLRGLKRGALSDRLFLDFSVDLALEERYRDTSEPTGRSVWTSPLARTATDQDEIREESPWASTVVVVDVDVRDRGARGRNGWSRAVNWDLITQEKRPELNGRPRGELWIGRARLESGDSKDQTGEALQSSTAVSGAELCFGTRPESIRAATRSGAAFWSRPGGEAESWTGRKEDSGAPGFTGAEPLDKSQACNVFFSSPSCPPLRSGAWVCVCACMCVWAHHNKRVNVNCLTV